jgi:ubiquinone biosynthesis protein
MWLFDLAWALVVFLVLRSVAARLLAVRLGLAVSVVCGALGLAAGLGLQRALMSDSGGLAPYVGFAVLSLLATMSFVALLGLAARPGQARPTPGPAMASVPRPFRALRLWLARSSRYLSILWLGARYGLGPLAGFRRPRDTRQLGVALRDALQEAGGIFVKFGQLLSARTDLVPAAIALELSSLQDDVRPLPASDILAVVDHELGLHADGLFADFDQTPLGAASIAQVHRASLQSGERVVVKVQRPDVEQLVERDLDILRRLAAAAEERAVWARQIGSVALAEGFAANLSEELDFRIEAQNMAAVAVYDGALRTPRVYPEVSTRRVLVEEWIDGRPLRQVQPDLPTAERKLLARSLLEGILGQIFELGVFHADPHAGNVLVDAEGRVVLLDFGSVGRLDRVQQSALALALAAIARRRAPLLRDALVELSTSAELVDLDGLEKALARFFVQRLGPGMEPGAEILNDLLAVVVRFGLALDPQLAGVFRALATLEGTLRLIDPAFSVVEEARRYAQARKLGLPRPEQLKQDVLDDLVELLPMLRNVPRRLDRVSAALERGELSLRIRPFADKGDAELVTRLTNRLVLAFFSASIGLVGVLLLHVGAGPEMLGTRFDVLLGYAGLVAATVLGLRVVVAATMTSAEPIPATSNEGSSEPSRDRSKASGGRGRQPARGLVSTPLDLGNAAHLPDPPGHHLGPGGQARPVASFDAEGRL